MPLWRSAVTGLTVTSVLLAFLLLQPVRVRSQNLSSMLSAADGSEVVSRAPDAATPLPAADFLGSYRPDGKFKKSAKRNCTVTAAMRPHRQGVDLPEGVDLRDHREMVIENFASPAHREEKSASGSPSGAMESLMARTHGREALLHAPTRLAVDSQQRLIVTDPVIASIHVLDSKQPFRIAGGEGRRLRQPNGLALDRQDNIYVADGMTGLILVYDRNGRFLHAIGTFQGEPIFQEPTGIAIDRSHDRLYVLDSPANELLVLDLDGRVLQRAGGHRRRGSIHFEAPNEIAVRGSSVVVLDFAGSRIQVLDLKCALQHAFWIPATTAHSTLPAMSIALDPSGNIYVSNGLPGIRVYRQNGILLGMVSNCDQPTPGIWIDGDNRIYVAEPPISRINLFQALPSVRSSPTLH